MTTQQTVNYSTKVYDNSFMLESYHIWIHHGEHLAIKIVEKFNKISLKTHIGATGNLSVYADSSIDNQTAVRLERQIRTFASKIIHDTPNGFMQILAKGTMQNLEDWFELCCKAAMKGINLAVVEDGTNAHLVFFHPEDAFDNENTYYVKFNKIRKFLRKENFNMSYLKPIIKIWKTKPLKEKISIWIQMSKKQLPIQKQ